MYAEYSECQRKGVANAAPSYDKYSGNLPPPPSTSVDGPVL